MAHISASIGCIAGCKCLNCTIMIGTRFTSHYSFRTDFSCTRVSGLAYNRRETRDKRLLNRDRNRCHLHTSLKLFWLRPMAPWTSAAACECAAAQSLDPWAAIKKASQECRGDTSSCPGPYPTAPCSEFHIGCRLGRELFTLPVCCLQCPRSHGLRPKKLYHTSNVAVTPAPVRFPIQRLLVQSFM